ncbi:MAG: hypothetical protein AAFQ43_09870 [Bacteroidota bacterium]
MRALLFLPVLLLAGCDALSSDDGYFDDPFLSVYAFSATGPDGATTEGTIGLTLIPSDVSSTPDLWTGRWDLDARGEPSTMFGYVQGRGTLRGETVYDEARQAQAISVRFYADAPSDDGVPEQPIGYEILIPIPSPVPEGGWNDADGTWTSFGGFAGGLVQTGTFEAPLRRRVTEYYVAG